MAERFGGKYSPTNDGAPDQAQPQSPVRNAFDGKRRTRVGGRVNLLFFAPLPLIFTAFWSDPAGLALYLAAFGTLILAAWLTREGLAAQEAFDARKVARRPAIPRKLFGSALTGAGLFLAGIGWGQGVITPAIFAVLGAGLHFLAFGPDPLKSKGLEGVDTFQTDRVARAVDEAEKHLSAMSDAIVRARDKGLERRVAAFQVTAREMFRTVEADPRDLTRTRRYLGVYLLGARDATVKFADFYAQTRDAKAKSDYETLLSDLESNFTAKTRQILLDDRSDLDVEIEVLRERLQREGLTPK